MLHAHQRRGAGKNQIVVLQVPECGENLQTMASVGQEPSGGDRWQCDLKGHGQEIGGGDIIWGARQDMGGVHLGIPSETLIGGAYAVRGERGEDDLPGVLGQFFVGD